MLFTMGVSDKIVRILGLVLNFLMVVLNVVSGQFCKDYLYEKPFINMCVDRDIQGTSGETVYLDSSGVPTFTNVECRCELQFSATGSVTIKYRAETDQPSGCGITFRLESHMGDEWGCQSKNFTYTVSQSANNMTYTKNDSSKANWFSCIGIQPVVNGGWTGWSSWSNCSCATSSNQIRIRSCTNPSPQNGGQDCYGSGSETQPCSGSCAVNGGWGAWGDWTSCSLTCGGGEQSRSRECNNPTPQNGGLSCPGNKSELYSCNAQLCPVDGIWGQWSQWSSCSMTCGDGTRSRSRVCDQPPPSNGGRPCSELNVSTETCRITYCPVNGGWGAWGDLTSCSLTCGGGEQSRSRECNNPTPQNGGLSCPGNKSELYSCNTQLCPVDGGWGIWSFWSLCSSSCGGGGSQTRTRICNSPAPLYGGRQCEGSNTENAPCGDTKCPIHGGWGEWSFWSQCSQSCGFGSQFRTRACDSPQPQYGGDSCLGYNTDNKTCNISDCPVDGNWGLWTNWGNCATTCGSAERFRSRYCNSPYPQYGGKSCSGESMESQTCSLSECPVNGNWGPWSPWSSCSVSCGEGTILRTRFCDSPSPQHGGSYCSGNSDERLGCNKTICPVNGVWGQWSSWSSCSASCGEGTILRKRFCDSPSPQHGGSYCSGNSEGKLGCNKTLCPVNGVWGPWSPWSICSITCGSGTVSRTRLCNNPEPVIGGNKCEGGSGENKTCTKDMCPTDGGVGPWSPWNGCSRSCDSGLRSRTRFCDNPLPAYGGKNCSEALKETEACNEITCFVPPTSESMTLASSGPSGERPATQAIVHVIAASSNIGAIIGGVIGGLLFVLLIVLLIICFVRRRRRKDTKRRPSEGPRSVRYFSTGDDVTVTENQLYNYDGETPSHATNALFVGGIPETPSSPGYIPHFSTDTGDRYAVIMDSTRTKQNVKERPKLQTFAPVKANTIITNGHISASDTVTLSENYSDDNLGVGVENPGYAGSYMTPYDEKKPSSTSPYDYIDNDKLQRDDSEFENLDGDYARLPESTDQISPDMLASSSNSSSSSTRTDEPQSERYKRFISSEPEESPDDGYLKSPKREIHFEFPDVKEK